MFVYFLILCETFAKKSRIKNRFYNENANPKTLHNLYPKKKNSTVRYTWYKHNVKQILNYNESDDGDKLRLGNYIRTYIFNVNGKFK